MKKLTSAELHSNHQKMSTSFVLCRYTLRGGECRTIGHFLKTLLEDHNLSNNNDILGQKTQNT